ncbi:hypothetical protein RAS1_06870 [Phycisphaerae bacterium RAS1]|nr:hypothetical protein RAS1_06870 [Phycisphaerae bacterium RAS1]
MDNRVASAIERDLYCTACGYNLRGLIRSGRCPECAEAVERSFQSAALALVDPRRRWRIAAALLAAGAAVPLSLVLAMLAARVIPPSTGSGIFLGLIAAAAMTAGTWVLLPRRPAGGPDEDAWVRRAAHTVGIAAIIVAAVLALLLSPLAPALTLRAATVAGVTDAAFWLLWVLLSVLIALLYHLVEDMAEGFGCHAAIELAQTACFTFTVTAPLALITAALIRLGASFAVVLIFAMIPLCGTAILVGVVAAVRLAVFVSTRQRPSCDDSSQAKRA